MRRGKNKLSTEESVTDTQHVPSLRQALKFPPVLRDAASVSLAATDFPVNVWMRSGPLGIDYGYSVQLLMGFCYSLVCFLLSLKEMIFPSHTL